MKQGGCCSGMKVKRKLRGDVEDIQLNMVRARCSFLLDARVKRPTVAPYKQPLQRTRDGSS